MTNKATETALNKLHAQLAETLTEMCSLDGEAPPSPAALAVAAKFLKDNSIFSAPENDDAMKSLEDKLKERQNRRTITKQDTQAALDSIGKALLQ